MISILPSSNPQDAQVIIVNLSTINKLKPISEVLDQFADLHYQYAPSWLPYKWYSKLWVCSNYLTMARTIHDYRLGKIDTEMFTKQLHDIFYFIPANKNPCELLKKAWNSLITWDDQSTQRLNYLIEKNLTLCLISNTNELNIQKIKQYIDNATKKTWDWQEQTLGKCKFHIDKNFRLMTSYENKVLKSDALIEKLVEQFLIEEKTRKNIILVSQYKPDLAKAKILGIESMASDQFFPSIPALKQISSSQTALNNTRHVARSANPAFLIPNNSLASSRRNLFGRVPKNEKNPSAAISEKTPLIRR